MSLNDTPSSERIHIGFFGMRNAGKSSLVNRVTGQELSVVSDVKGTTTDPVRKAMELLPLGPVVIIDTPGLDDTGYLGEKRVAQARKILEQVDIAVLVTEAGSTLSAEETELIGIFKDKDVPYIIACNKSDLGVTCDLKGSNVITVSAKTGENIHELKEMLASYGKKEQRDDHLVSDLLRKGEMVILVVPIDESAPKGRLILPQQQVMRDILDAGGYFATCQPSELKAVLDSLKEPPQLVITDSQAFAEVAKIVPEDVDLTSFSILMVRYKGDLKQLTEGARRLAGLKDGDRVLIAEGCTHHRQCNDIGTVKLPKLIRKYSGAMPEFSFVSGGEFPDDLSDYDLIVHCGGCMLNNKAMKHRLELARNAGIPIVNYGVAIAQMRGILDRSIQRLLSSM
ncbi:MAG: [Clostridiales bacterium]|nr:[FeFe] hydrogenase H-cluster maturation GTPase HydF [Clostridiales bacterium]